MIKDPKHHKQLKVGWVRSCHRSAWKVKKNRLQRNGFWLRLHHDERGTISIASVFALLMLAFILGMVMNSTRQVDQKIKMQNAADAATHAGSVQLSRSMNSLAFTNHLLADVFALTAFFREARDGNAIEQSLEVLDHWRRVAPELAGSEFPKFAELGRAIEGKVPLEEELVAAWATWAAAGAQLMLPVFEEILLQEMIPNFQRDLILHTPRLAQLAADETARRHGQDWPVETELRAVLWRTYGDVVGGESEEFRRTMPVVDPVLDLEVDQQDYFNDAVSQRYSHSHRYLDEWNNESMRFFDQDGKMSQFANLWRTYTCGQLDQLLGENATRNLPMQIRRMETSIVLVDDVPETDDGLASDAYNQSLEWDYMVVGVVYAEPIEDRIPRIFRNPMPNVSTAFAQAQFFVPLPRLILPTRRFVDPPFASAPNLNRHRGGIPGEFIDEPEPFAPRQWLSAERWDAYDDPYLVYRRQNSSAFPSRWDLTTQNWETQLVPATAEQLPLILSTAPPLAGFENAEFPALQSLSPEQMSWLTHH